MERAPPQPQTLPWGQSTAGVSLSVILLSESAVLAIAWTWMSRALSFCRRFAPLALVIAAQGCINKGATAITFNNGASAGASGEAGAAAGSSSLGGVGGGPSGKGGAAAGSSARAGAAGAEDKPAPGGSGGAAGAPVLSDCDQNAALCPHETYVVGPLPSDSAAFVDLSQRTFAVGGAVGDERVFWAVRETFGDVTVRYWKVAGQPLFKQGTKLGSFSLDAPNRCPAWADNGATLAIAADEARVYVSGCDTIYAFDIGDGPSAPATARSVSAPKSSVFPVSTSNTETLFAEAGALSWYSYCVNDTKAGSCLGVLPAGSNGDSAPETFAFGPQGPNTSFGGFVSVGASAFGSFDNAIYLLDPLNTTEPNRSIYNGCVGSCLPPIVDDAFVHWGWRSGSSLTLVQAQRSNLNSQSTRSVSVPLQAGKAGLCTQNMIPVGEGRLVIANCEAFYVIEADATTATRFATLTPTGNANLVRSLTQLTAYHGRLYAFDSSPLVASTNSFAIVRIDLPL